MAEILKSGSTHIDSKVYVKPMNIGLLLHNNSRVNQHYKRSLLKTMVDCVFLFILAGPFFRRM